MRIGVARRGGGEWAGGPDPSMWAADALFSGVAELLVFMMVIEGVFCVFCALFDIGCCCRSILRRGSRFNASDLSYQQSSKSAARTGSQVTTAVDEVHVPTRRRARSTDVASRVALLASIPLASGDDTGPRTSQSQHHHNTQTLEVSQEDGGLDIIDRQSPALVSGDRDQSVVDVEDHCQSVSFDYDLPQSPNTEESRQVHTH